MEPEAFRRTRHEGRARTQIRPKPYLLEALSADIEATARALSGRARKAHLAARAAERFSESEKLAGERENMLQPLPESPRDRDQEVLDELRPKHPALRKPANSATEQCASTSGCLEYKIIEAAVMGRSFFTYAREEGRLVLALNPSHPFYKQIYKPLADSRTPRDRQLRTQLELLLLALARAEAAEEDGRALACMVDQGYPRDPGVGRAPSARR